MGENSSEDCGRGNSNPGSIGRKVRVDTPVTLADAAVPVQLGKSTDAAEICACYSDGASMTEGQRDLAVRHLPLARAIAWRAVQVGTSEGEELEAAAYMALVEAALTFDPSRKVNFATYARYRIRGAIRDYRRLILSEGWRGDPAHRPVFETLRRNSEELGRVLGSEPDRPVGAELESTEAVERWLRRLPRTQAAACRLIYLHGMSQDEAAAFLGCSKSYMSRLHREAIARLIHEYHAACGSQGTADRVE
jgi:RNA polymerase sigma factor (sigma-70 family)